MGAWEEQLKRTDQSKKLWSEAQQFDFIKALQCSTNEEEVKAAYIREFSLPVNTQERHDLVVEKVLFEFKYSVNLNNIDVTAKIAAQAIYYINRLFNKGRLNEAEYLVIADRDEARIFRVRDFQLFYESQDYQWNNFRPSSPDPLLIEAVKDSKIIESNRVYRLTHKDDLHLFSTRLYKLVSPAKVTNKLHLDQNLSPRSRFWLLGLGLILALLISVFWVSQYHLKNTRVPDPVNID